MKKLGIILVMEGAFSIILAVLIYSTAALSNGLYLLSLPFDLAGKGLRWLSLSSAPGNVAAILLYIIICCCPLLYFLLRFMQGRYRKADLLLLLTSLYVFFLLYVFINPRRMPHPSIMESGGDDGYLTIVKFSLSLIFYSLLLAYFILSYLSHVEGHVSANKWTVLCQQLNRILIFFCGLYVFIFFYFNTFILLDRLEAYIHEKRTIINFIYPVLNYILEGLPILFLILTLLSAAKLLRTMITDHLQEAEYLAAHHMGIVSRRAVATAIICNILINALQLLLSRWLNDTDYRLNISLLPLVVAFMGMILSGYFKESMDINNENNMII